MDVPNPYQCDLLMQLHFSGISPPQLVHNLPLIRAELRADQNPERQLLLKSGVHPHNYAGEQSQYGSNNNNFWQHDPYLQQMQQQGVPMMGAGAQQNHDWARAQHAARMAYLQRSQMNSGQPPPPMPYPHQQNYQQMPSGQQVPMYTQPVFPQFYCSQPGNYMQWMQAMQRSAMMIMSNFRHESGQGIPQMNPPPSTHHPVQPDEPSATTVYNTENESATIPLCLADGWERKPASKQGGNAPHKSQPHTRQDVQMHSKTANQEPKLMKRTMGNDRHQKMKHPCLTPPTSTPYISTQSKKPSEKDTTTRYDMGGPLIIGITSSPSSDITLDSSKSLQSQKCARSEPALEEACSDLKSRLREKLETHRSIVRSTSGSPQALQGRGDLLQCEETYAVSSRDSDPSTSTTVSTSGNYHQTLCQKATSDFGPDDPNNNTCQTTLEIHQDDSWQENLRETSTEPPVLTPHHLMSSSPDQDATHLTPLPGPELVPEEQIKEEENDHAQSPSDSSAICHPKKSKLQKKELERIVKANKVKRPTFHFLDTNGLEDEIVRYEKMENARFARILSNFMAMNNVSRVQLAEMTETNPYYVTWFLERNFKDVHVDCRRIFIIWYLRCRENAKMLQCYMGLPTIKASIDMTFSERQISRLKELITKEISLQKSVVETIIKKINGEIPMTTKTIPLTPRLVKIWCNAKFWIKRK